MLVPILDEIMVGAAGTGTRHIDARHGASRPAERAGARPAQAVRADPGRVQGSDRDADAAARSRLDGRREVPRRRAPPQSPRGQMFVSMAPNPSHLEAVNPVVAGMARAAGTLADRAGAPIFDGAMTLPVLIHGDMAFPGQGIVAETLNLSRLDGYHTDGTHPHHRQQPARASPPRRASPTAPATPAAWRAASRFRSSTSTPTIPRPASRRRGWRGNTGRVSGKDFLIDLVGYRRHGHNEGDEPAFTQPVMYQTITAHPTVRELFARLAGRSTARCRGDAVDALVKKHFTVLEQTLRVAQARGRLRRRRSRRRCPPGLAGQDADRRADRAAARPQRVAAGRRPKASPSTRSSNAAAIGSARCSPTSNERTVDWAGAEELALASILAEGMPDPPDRRGRAARHLQPPPRGAARRGNTASSTCRCSSCRRRGRRSRSTTARSPRARPSASSSATTCRSRGTW